ncbi:aldo/keto reductase [Xylanimonas allomyrinae]|uniref:Aldo/keto reductase n=1 Tax=Xylanimonas allomyrinae TaxID=2509459 RepID=A0A4P6EZI3_9MICO|nr:aldo/keto reductase [Xylanimonas allomyrinae]QAY63478.1 aldo/keto reductase [Xylanimonas allomyrinae]
MPEPAAPDPGARDDDLAPPARPGAAALTGFLSGPGRLGYGAANVGNLYRAMTDDDAHAILQAAWDAGIRHFDTAPHYGLGLSERRLGAFLRTKPRDQYVVSTKVGRLLVPHPAGAGTLDLAEGFAVPADVRREWDVTAAGVRRSLEESLARLGLDAVDVVYLHDPERFDLDRGLGEGLPAVAALRDAGLVRAVGVGSMVDEALLRAARSGLVDLLMIAGRFTLADPSAAAQVLPACRRHGVRVVAAAVFNSGLTARSEPPDDARFDYGPAAPELLARVRRIAAVCREHDVDLPVAAVQYPLRADVVASVVVGGGRPEQVRQNAARLARPVPEALWAALASEGLAV